MEKITRNEVLNNKFARTKGGVVTVTCPTREQAESMTYRDLCIVMCGSGALKFRPVDKAVENANIWFEQNDREKLMRMWF